MKKMRFSMIFAAMSAFVVLSCVEEQDMSPVTEGQMTFNVVAEQTVSPEPGLKSVIAKDQDGHHSVLWSENDVIKVYNEVRPEGVDFTLTGTAGASTASFTGPKTEGAAKYYAAYPSVAGSTCNDGVFSGLVVPAVQTAVAGTYPADAYVSVAAADEEGNFQFRNACALLKIELGSEYAYVKKIVIEDKDGEAALAGTFSCTLGADGITMGEVTGASKSVTLLPPSGKKAFEPGVYYVSCLPESLGGVKLTCTTVVDDQTSKTGGEIALKRNMVLALPVVDAAIVALPIVPEDKSYNSYIVTPGQSLTFTKKKAGIISLELAWQDASTLISDMSVNNETGKVTIATNEVAGNALVLGKDANGKTLWSWHVWAVDFNPETTAVTVDGVTFMDRNLGAINATPGDVGAVGQAYQWGRKDPMPRVSDPAKENYVVYDIDGNLLDVGNSGDGWYKMQQGGTLAESIANPDMFFRARSDRSWIEDADYQDWWGGVSFTKSEYDPCPQGWKVPVISSTGANPYQFMKTEAAAFDSKNIGVLYTGTSGETLWFPCNGQRSRSKGWIHNVDSDGNYWLGTDKADKIESKKYKTAEYLSFKSGSIGLTAAGGRAIYQVLGCGVRCVKE